MLVLGLDPSLTQFGWALHDDTQEGVDRCPARGRFKTPSKMLFIDRYCHMRESLRELVQTHQPDCIGIEYPVFNDLWSEGMYGLFLYSCEALRDEGVDVVFFSPMQVKVHARLSLGRPKGWKMLKGDMVDAAKEDCGGKGRWNHNEADAYLVARTAARFWRLFKGLLTADDLTEPERKQFLKIHTYTRGKKAGLTERKGIMFRESERFFRWSEISRRPHGDDKEDHHQED